MVLKMNDIKTGAKVIDFSKPRTGYITSAEPSTVVVTWHSTERTVEMFRRFSNKCGFLEYSK